MQEKKDPPSQHARETKRIVVEVSWDTAEIGNEIPTLVGEWSDWEDTTPVTPEPRDGGAREREVCTGDARENGRPVGHRRGRAALNLQDGIYAYKLRASRGFFLNRAEPRTTVVGSFVNNVLSVQGAEEPILHAAAPPFVHHPGDGGVVLRAAVRHGASEGLRVVWSEGEPSLVRETKMSPTVASDSHRYFQARIPASADCVSYAFLLDGGELAVRTDGSMFTARGSGDDDTPAWWSDAVVYTIFVDRFRSSRDTDEWDIDPGPMNWAGGDLIGIRRSLDHLAELGINTLYLTPIHVASSCHRYDVIDPTRVDPALGGEEAFDALLGDMHARGMRLILDWSFCHAGSCFAPYRDVTAHGRASRFADWFQWTQPEMLAHGADAADGVAHYRGCTMAPLLNLKNADLAAYALDTAEHWISRGVDGLRIDCAAQVPMDILARLRARVRALNPEAVVVGELVPVHGWRWRAAGALDASTDFGFYRLAVDRFASPLGETVDLASRWERLLAERGPEPVHHAIRFLSTHDFPRFFSLTRAAGREKNDMLALAWLLTMPGVPMLLYGEEMGMRSDVAELEPESVWRDRAPFPWRRAASTGDWRALLRDLLRVRARSAALRSGEVESMMTDGPLWVYRRRAPRDVVDIAIHQGDQPLVIELGDDELPDVTVRFKVGNVQVQGQCVTFEGPGAVVLGRSPPKAHRLPYWRSSGPSRARDETFRLGSERAEYPRRLDVSLIERCNLKCAHCITLAPERTAHGSARSMTPFVVARLGAALRHAEHIGFVHGGESLTSPLFFEFMQAIRDARGDEPVMVHLLTNGMLLSRSMTEKLVRAGVRSISVSLDGASATTNDAVRSGARFAKLMQHLEDAAKARREGGFDLRLGLTTVVLPNNLDELGRVVDIAADLGLDWVKFEELVPATPWARTSLLRLDDDRARSAVRAACAHATARGITAVDHTTPMPRWVCTLDACAESNARHRADEYVNRAALNSCRDPWELACVEPNGDVRIGAFHGAVAGNLAEESMLEVWNSEAARNERQRSRVARRCWGNEVTCLLPQA
jgi:cyclomaltodextrinase